MRNVHDVGGMLAYGEVPKGDGKPFHSEWERLAFGLTLASIANGFLHNVDENRYAKERMRPTDLIQCSYYELWLAALELNLIENGVLSLEDIEERSRAISAQGDSWTTPAVADPEQLHQAIDGMIAFGGDMSGEVDSARRFMEGDAVIVDPMNNRRHSRVPGYTAGRVGVVTRAWKAYPVPQVVAHESVEARAWCYQVRFDADTLWAGGSDGAGSVFLDVFENDLRPAGASN